MQQDENTPTDGRKTEENAQNIQHVQSAAADGRPALYGRKVLSFVRRSARLDARLQRAWDTYADTYLLNINAGEGSLDVREGFVFDQAYIRETWGNTNPMIVEIGSGQGENVVAAAAARPAAAQTRAAMFTSTPRKSSPTARGAPVCTPARRAGR